MNNYFGFAKELLLKGLAQVQGPYEQVQLYDLLVQGDEDLDFYLGLARRASGKILDLACGSGRLLLPLAVAGFSVVGLDLSAEMLKLTREKLGAFGQNVQLVQGDMRSFNLGQRFRLIIIPYFSFIYMLSDQQRCQVLQGAYEHLQEGGYLAFNFLTGQTAQGEGWPTLALQGIHPLTGEILISVVQIKGLGRGLRLLNQINYALDQKSGAFQITVQASKEGLVSAQRMQKLVQKCGFSVQGVYGDYTLSHYDGGEECLILAEKPES